MKILIIGATGFLGRKLMNFLSKSHEVYGASLTKEKGIKKVDATDINEVSEIISTLNPEIVIDTVSLSSSIECENNPSLAERLNYLTAKNIQTICEKNGSKMIFISSSYVFDGISGNYSENDMPCPVNQYGKTKEMAENEIKKLKEYLILRVDLMYGFNGINLPNGVFSKIISRKNIYVSDLNQQRSPIFVDDVVKIIDILLKTGKNGIFHLSGDEKISYFKFLKRLEKIKREKTKIFISQSNSSKGLTIPQVSTLNNSKLKNLGIFPSSLNEGLENLKKQFINFIS